MELGADIGDIILGIGKEQTSTALIASKNSINIDAGLWRDTPDYEREDSYFSRGLIVGMAIDVASAIGTGFFIAGDYNWFTKSAAVFVGAKVLTNLGSLAYEGIQRLRERDSFSSWDD